MTERVLVSINDGVADVRLNRPEKKNALDGEMFDGIRTTVERISDDASVRVVVLSGEGGSFSAGLDVASLGEMATGELNQESDSIKEATQNLLDICGAMRTRSSSASLLLIMLLRRSPTPAKW